MAEIKKISVEQKLEYYRIARDMFNNRFSHPQVIEKLTMIGCDKEMSNIIAEKALPEKWDELFTIARNAYNKGMRYDEVFNSLNALEDDKEIAKFIADTWYEVKGIAVENIIESPTNIMEGTLWMIIGGIGVFAAFYFDLTLVSKIIWSMAFVFATLQYLYGKYQRKVAKKVRKFMEDEQN
jgi:hypothetical protein